MVLNKHFRAIEPYRDNSCVLNEAHLRYGGSQGLFRCASQSIAYAGRGDDGAGSRELGDDEIRALRQFASEGVLFCKSGSELPIETSQFK